MRLFSSKADVTKAISHADVDITIPPFKSSEIRVDTKSSICRIVFEADDGEYQLDVHDAAFISPLKPDPSQKLRAIFHKSAAHVAVLSDMQLNSWMSKLNDDSSLMSLSIPGTHNSSTCYKALPSVRCQAVSVTKQLNSGIRFLDLRCQEEKGNLILVHGSFPISLSGTKYLVDVLNECYEFLENNPSEAILMSLKREGRGDGTDQEFSKLLYNKFVDKDRWWTRPEFPTLGNARGKIVLIRRFNLDSSLENVHEPGLSWGVNAENWAYNTPNNTTPLGDICVQDFCEVLHPKIIEQKITYVQDHLNRAANDVSKHEAKKPLYINFLSAANFHKTSTWPGRIAEKVNPAISQYLAKLEARSVGVVVQDFVGQNGDFDLSRLIVAMNRTLEHAP